MIVFGDIKLGNVETIEEHAFQYASVRGNIDLGNNLKYLGTGAFYGVTMEKGNIVIPGSLESIGSYAFQNFMAPNSNLVLNEGLVNLDSEHFYDGGSVKVANAKIKCWKSGGHGHQSFLQVVENSCNPGDNIRTRQT